MEFFAICGSSVTARHGAVERFERAARQTLARIRRVLTGVAHDAPYFFGADLVPLMRIGRFVDLGGFHKFLSIRITKPV